MAGSGPIPSALSATYLICINTYALPVPPDVQGYMDRLVQLSSVKAWIEGALAERDFRAFEEPYRLGRDIAT